ncbi:class IV adenylate cyclase [Megalodesulfovibrio gigas]|uniref:Putative adenylate cyclase n=1 Tax=Megalodesulfovibrio gigas (strain ATCC 19364 / DSM 1382 / NCIMB 9332 / VKM B-1759) TaxID=1121448 RepID=T2GGG7_MEGG1|nr:class IV adenylate cyclase [Megalodesulfovibrio gigas]AGW15152.1 putative adenylate cyclase [Megalodesulfovibrio gigas DSM 1382 = ATCC 19364]
MPTETETKFAGVDHDALRRRLQALGARRVSLVFEDNAVWDTIDRKLRQKGQLLRLRQDDAIRLTFKTPAPGGTGQLKVVEEHETQVEDAQAMGQVLAGLGLLEVFRYQKLRETWVLDEESGGVLCLLDRLPFGDFLELEGPAEALAQACRALGLDPLAGTSKTYHALHQEHCARLGLPAEDSFVFSEAQARQLHALVRD